MDLKQGGNFLRGRRKALGMTIEDVVRSIEARTGVKMVDSDISRMENGRITSPSLEKAVAYGMFLGATPNEVARAFSLWAPPQRERLTQIGEQLGLLPAEEAAQLLENLAALVRDALYGRAQASKNQIIDI